MSNTFDTNAYLRAIIASQANDDINRERINGIIKGSILLKDKRSEIIRMSVIPLLYIDAYKVLKFRLKNGLGTEAEYQMISYLDKVESQEELCALFLSRNDYLNYSIGCVETFNNTPYLGKIRMIKSLSEAENSNLSDFTELHSNDLEMYNIEITEDFIYNYFKKYSEHLTKENVNHSPDKILEALAGFIQNIYIKNGEEIYDMVCDINERVFSHIDELKKVFDSDYQYIDMLVEDYYKDPEEFNDYTLYECPVLVDTLSIYILMRDYNILKGKKVLKNERNE